MSEFSVTFSAWTFFSFFVIGSSVFGAFAIVKAAARGEREGEQASERASERERERASAGERQCVQERERQTEREREREINACQVCVFVHESVCAGMHNAHADNGAGRCFNCVNPQLVMHKRL